VVGAEDGDARGAEEGTEAAAGREVAREWCEEEVGGLEEGGGGAEKGRAAGGGASRRDFFNVVTCIFKISFIHLRSNG
jgi:hypothetical protein